MISQCYYEPSGRHQPSAFFLGVGQLAITRDANSQSRSSSNQRTGNDDIIVHQQGGSQVTSSEFNWLKKHRRHRTTRLQK